MKNKIVLVSSLCLVVLIAALPLISCGPARPSTEGKELKVGFMSPSSGVAAEKGAPMGHGNLDAVEYINTELGGVNGYKIKAMWYDSAYDTAKIIPITKKFMDDGALLFVTASSKEMTDAMETANRASFPGIATFTAPNIYRPPEHIYGQMPDYGDAWAAFASYYMKNVWKGPGKPRMAMHLLNNPTGAGAGNAARALADRLGIEIIATAEHTATTTSEIESLTRIKSLNPDVIFISSTPAPTAVIIRNARDLGLFPKVPIACAHASFTKALIDIAGASVVEGIYGVFPTVMWDENVPGLAKAAEYAKKNNPKDYGNADYLTSWAASLIVAEILRLALQNSGYEVLTKGDISSWKAVETNGIQKLKDFKVNGLHGPVTYTPGDNRLNKSMRLYTVKDGKIVPVTEWIEAPLIKYEEFSWWKK